MYYWLIDLFYNLGLDKITFNFCGNYIEIMTAETLSGIITIVVIISVIFAIASVILLPSKIMHQIYHKWAKKRGIKQ